MSCFRPSTTLHSNTWTSGWKIIWTKIKNQQIKIINQTHQEIAYELNSSRVVISRLLKVMENEGKIRLNRNNIELLWCWMSDTKCGMFMLNMMEVDLGCFYIIKYTFKKSHISKSNFSRLLRDDGSQKWSTLIRKVHVFKLISTWLLSVDFCVICEKNRKINSNSLSNWLSF